VTVKHIYELAATTRTNSHLPQRNVRRTLIQSHLLFGHTERVHVHLDRSRFLHSWRTTSEVRHISLSLASLPAGARATQPDKQVEVSDHIMTHVPPSSDSKSAIARHAGRPTYSGAVGQRYRRQDPCWPSCRRFSKVRLAARLLLGTRHRPLSSAHLAHKDAITCDAGLAERGLVHCVFFPPERMEVLDPFNSVGFRGKLSK